MESADAYAMLRIHCLPPSSDKQHDAAQGFFVDAPLLCSQLPLYLGRAKKGKEDKALRDFGLQAEAIRFPDSKSLLMAHRRTTLSKRQLQFDWDTANGCMVMTVCGNTAVSVDGEQCLHKSALPETHNFEPCRSKMPPEFEASVVGRRSHRHSGHCDPVLSSPATGRRQHGSTTGRCSWSWSTRAKHIVGASSFNYNCPAAHRQQHSPRRRRQAPPQRCHAGRAASGIAAVEAQVQH